MTKFLVLVLAYFNYDDIDRCLQSLMKQKDDLEDQHSIDIVVLENPSKYSEKMAEMVRKYSNRIKAHYLCSQNIEMVCFQAFCLQHRSKIQEQYEMICVTEGDVVLKDGSMRECFSLISPEQPVCSIEVSLENLKIPPHPADAIHWIPTPRVFEDHKEGPFGLQFVMFTQKYFYTFIDALEKKTLAEVIPLGEKVNTFSDTNLRAFMAQTGVKLYKTLNTDLVHIGWDHFLDRSDEYWQHRDALIREKKIRVNHNPDTVELILQSGVTMNESS